MTRQPLQLILVLATILGCQPESVPATDGSETSATGDGDGEPGDGDGDADQSRTILLHVISTEGPGIPQASVTIDGDVHFTDSAGFLHIDDPQGPNFLARVDSAGFTSGVVALELSDGLHAYEQVHLFPLGEPLPLDADLGGTVEFGGTRVSFPPGALVNRFGEVVTGSVDVTITNIDPTIDDIDTFPAPLEARNNLDEDVLLLTLGMTEISVWQAGQPLDLAPNVFATLQLAIPADLVDDVEIDQQIPAWSLDLDAGIWVEENLGTVESVDGELVWTTEVNHFTYYNCDSPIDFEQFECYVISVEDNQGNPVNDGFTLISADGVGIFFDGGYSSNGEDNVVSNCAVAPIGSTPVLTLLSHPGDYTYEIVGATGQTNLCWDPNAQCGLIRVTLGPQAPPVICQMGDYMVCPYSGPENTEDIGACAAGNDYCIAAGTEWSGCVGEYTPAMFESCLTPFDDDCDGASDDPDAIDCECTMGETTPCYSGPLATLDVGVCVSGVRMCDPDAMEYMDTCVGEVTPEAEDCDSPEDEDCNGSSNCDPPPEAPVNLTLSFSPIKQFDFSWTPALGATYYQLLEKHAEDIVYQPVGAQTVATSTSLTVPLHKRAGTSYIVQACNDAGCTDSAVVDVMGTMVEAIGYFKASNTDTEDMFGFSVALSGDGNTLAVGAPEVDISVGAVYLFVYDSQDGWSQQAVVTASNAWPDYQFGQTVALSNDGNTMVVGSPFDSSLAAGVNGDQWDQSGFRVGAAYVFVRDNEGTWSQQAYLKPSNPGDDHRFGIALALSGDANTLAIGSTGERSNATGIGGNQADNSAVGSGAVYLFVRDNQDAWSQQAYIKASNTNPNDWFGTSIALSGNGDSLTVGASGEDSTATGIDGNQANNSGQDVGAVYVFVRNNQDAWSQQAYVKASNSGGYFGSGVALSDNGNVMAVGAQGERSNATGINGNQLDQSLPGAGAVYVFMRDGQGVWSQDAYVKASNTGLTDEFGRHVSLSADGITLAVASRLEASNATGINGDQTDNSLNTSGAAYVFVRNAQLEWMQSAYVKASNTGFGDEFGVGLALSGDGSSLAVGAQGESSTATGIGGDASDDSAPYSGAVYLY